MTIYDRFVLRLLRDVYIEARSNEARRRYSRSMRRWDLNAFERFYTSVERLRPITFNPWTDILVERYDRVRRRLAENEGLYEETGWPYNL